MQLLTVNALGSDLQKAPPRSSCSILPAPGRRVSLLRLDSYRWAMTFSLVLASSPGSAWGQHPFRASCSHSHWGPSPPWPLQDDTTLSHNPQMPPLPLLVWGTLPVLRALLLPSHPSPSLCPLLPWEVSLAMEAGLVCLGKGKGF